MSPRPLTSDQLQQGSIKALRSAGAFIVQDDGTVVIAFTADVFQDRKQCKRLCRHMRNAAPISPLDLFGLIKGFMAEAQIDLFAAAVPDNAIVPVGEPFLSHTDDVATADPLFADWQAPQAASAPGTQHKKRPSDGDLNVYGSADGPSDAKYACGDSADGPARTKSHGNGTTTKNAKKRPSGFCPGDRDTQFCSDYSSKKVAQRVVFKTHFRDNHKDGYKVDDENDEKIRFQCFCGELFGSNTAGEDQFAEHMWRHVIGGVVACASREGA